MFDKFLRPLIPGGGKKRKPASRKTKRNNAIPADATHTFTVQKAYCVPAEGIIRNALEPRGIKIHAYSERVVYAPLRTLVDKRLADQDTTHPVPSAQEATVVVSAAQANWAEYLMERTLRLVVVGGRVNPRNAEWAAKFGGRLPTPWSAGKAPWVEPGCKHGQQCIAKLHKRRQHNA